MAHRGGEVFEGGPGQPRHPQRPGQPVAGQHVGPKDFREPPGSGAAHDVHLEQAVLGMDESQRKIGVILGVGLDPRDAVGIARDRYRSS